jgi:hypothetical protein
LTSVKRPQSGNSGLISDLRSKTSLLEQPLQKWSPAKHLFVTQSSQPKSDLSALNLDWLSSVVIPTRGGTAARSRNSWGTPRGYPFKLKAAAASPLVAKECAAPVVCRLASGADAPKSVHSVLRLCRCAASRGGCHSAILPGMEWGGINQPGAAASSTARAPGGQTAHGPAQNGH